MTATSVASALHPLVRSRPEEIPIRAAIRPVEVADRPTGNNGDVNVADPASDDTDQVEDEFRSLLEGLRTTLPGVQLVTAFLLTVPLYDKYDELGHSER